VSSVHGAVLVGSLTIRRSETISSAVAMVRSFYEKRGPCHPE
jgi:hypothetical protein